MFVFIKKYRLILLIASIILTTIIFVFALNFRNSNNTSKNIKDKIKVSATFFPLYDLTKSIGGDKVEVINLTKIGVDPHDFEPTSEDLKTIYSSKLLISHGENFDEWTQKIESEAEKNGVKILKTSQKVDLINFKDIDSFHTGDAKESSSNKDPHFWLDPERMQAVATNIKNKLIEIDSENKNIYENNTERLILDLKNLDKSYQKGLQNCSKKEAILTHEAFGYLANKYNLKFTSLGGISPEAEISAFTLQRIADKITELNTKYILVENTFDENLSKKLADELKVEIIPVSTLENLTESEKKVGLNYQKLMENNLNSLKKTFDCN